MNQFTLSILVFIGGIFLATQTGLNANLGVLLKNQLLASLVPFVTSSLFAITFVIFSVKEFPLIQYLKEIPFYLWFTGDYLSL